MYKITIKKKNSNFINKQINCSMTIEECKIYKGSSHWIKKVGK